MTNLCVCAFSREFTQNFNQRNNNLQDITDHQLMKSGCLTNKTKKKRKKIKWPGFFTV